MTPLPAWAATPEARTLLAAIRLEQPGYFCVRRHAWTDQRRPKFQGANARALRGMWEAALDAAMDANDRDAVTRLRNHEDPDELIERMLSEPAVPYTRMALDECPQNRRPRVAA